MPSGVFPKHRTAVTCLTEKIRVLDEPLPGVSHYAVGHAFTVNESTIQYIQKKEEEMCRSVQDAAPVSAKSSL